VGYCNANATFLSYNHYTVL